MTRHCVVCECPIGKLETTCGQPACLKTWQGWRNEAAGRPSHLASQPLPEPAPQRPACITCGAQRRLDSHTAGVCLKCAAKSARHDKACDVCSRVFTPIRKTQLRCSEVCTQAAMVRHRATRVRDRSGEAARRREKLAAKEPALACASCEHGRLSRSSETGYACGLDAAMRCRPYGPAALYVSWEAQANG
jgi:hypothetical protein